MAPNKRDTWGHIVWESIRRVPDEDLKPALCFPSATEERASRQRNLLSLSWSGALTRSSELNTESTCVLLHMDGEVELSVQESSTHTVTANPQLSQSTL